MISLGVDVWQIRNIIQYSKLGGHVLTTKFGNFSIRDKDKTEVESKMEIVLEIEKGSAKVRFSCDRDRQGPSWTRLVD